MHCDVLICGVRTFPPNVFYDFFSCTRSLGVIRDILLIKTSTNPESKQTPGSKLYLMWLLYFGIIYLQFWKNLIPTKLCLFCDQNRSIKNCEHSILLNIHCSYSSVCLSVFALYLLDSVSPFFLFCFARDNSKTARFIWPPDFTFVHSFFCTILWCNINSLQHLQLYINFKEHFPDRVNKLLLLFLAQLIRASHWHHKATVSNPAEFLNFSGFST